MSYTLGLGSTTYSEVDCVTNPYIQIHVNPILGHDHETIMPVQINCLNPTDVLNKYIVDWEGWIVPSIYRDVVVKKIQKVHKGQI